ncbi:MAG: hypothetical protein OQJ84_07595, partial [Xanthomonadales bacterium]|nr:hypothetical protein [Xanthomonadales bacterium]
SGDNRRYLHPKFVTTLLNDLFGIQSRAGCSCAGPYGHRLLDIDEETSEEYRVCVIEGYSGIKPGWVRISMHYVMDDLEVNFLLDAVDFIAKHGGEFLRLYAFDMHDGSWHMKDDTTCLQRFSLEAALSASNEREPPMPHDTRNAHYQRYLDEARQLAEKLRMQGPLMEKDLEGMLGDLQFFTLPECCTSKTEESAGRGLMGKLKSLFSK